MPRRDRDDDDSGEFPRPRGRAKGGIPAWGWALIIGGFALVVCGGGGTVVAVLVLGARAQQQVAADANADTLRAKVWTREEFRAAVMGKTEAEVIAAVGKPDRTDDNGHAVHWDYSGRTMDPATGKKDFSVSLTLSKGRVERVAFF